MTGNCQVRFLEDGVGSNPTLLFDISPIIGNIALNGLENALAKKFYSRSDGTIDKSHRNKHKINYVRLADDFVVTTDSSETAHEIIEHIQTFLDPRGLKLSEEKTLVTNISEGFNFLGWNFRKYKDKLLSKPSKDSQKEIIKKIGEVIGKAKAWDQDRLIRILNPIIRVHVHRPPAVTLNETPEEFHIST